MNKVIKNLIEEYKDEGVFSFVLVTDEMLAVEECKIGLSFPNE